MHPLPPDPRLPLRPGRPVTWSPLFVPSLSPSLSPLALLHFPSGLASSPCESCWAPPSVECSPPAASIGFDYAGNQLRPHKPLISRHPFNPHPRPLCRSQTLCSCHPATLPARSQCEVRQRRHRQLHHLLHQRRPGPSRLQQLRRRPRHQPQRGRRLQRSEGQGDDAYLLLPPVRQWGERGCPAAAAVAAGGAASLLRRAGQVAVAALQCGCPTLVEHA